MTGTVSYVVRYHSNLYNFLIQDRDDGVDMRGSIRSAPPLPGDKICISGTVVQHATKQPLTRFSSFEILDHGMASEPVARDAADIMSGQYDFRRSHLIGEVRDVQPSGSDPCWNYISLICDTNQYYAPVPIRGANLSYLKTLIGSVVRLDGYPDPYNCSFRFLDERRFVVAGTNNILVLSPPLGNPFPLTPSIDKLRQLPMERIAKLGRHKATGRILTFWNESHALLCLPDQRRIHVSFDTTNTNALPNLSRGSLLEVIGYPSTDGFTLTLTHALGREVDNHPIRESVAKKFSESDFRNLTRENYFGKSILQGKRIELCGTVGSFSQEHLKRRTFPLSLADHLLDVNFSSASSTISGITSSCRIRVRGTCVLDTENWAMISDGTLLNGIRLVLDRPDDLEILARPPWWTPARLAFVVAALLVALVAFIIWNRTLNRLSEKRGRELFHERTANALAELKTMERTRLAVELHDSISQILTGAALQLDAGETNAAKRILASCRRELRSCLWELRSNAIDAENLADAFRETIAPHLGDRKALIDIDIPSSVLSEELRHASLRIVREATVNAIRHGRATTVAISGELTGKRLTLAIVDNGRGFDSSVSQGSAIGHFGLLGMRERAKAFNGSVSIVSAPGSGTEVTVVLEDRAGYDFGEDSAERNAANT